MKRGTAHHIKFDRLCQLLKIPRYAGIGILEGIWHIGQTQAKRGDIGKWSDGDIAAWLGWEKDAKELVAALVRAGWLDRCGKHRLVIHDWHVHCDQTVRRSAEVLASGLIGKAEPMPEDASNMLAIENGNEVLADPPNPMPLPTPTPTPKKENPARKSRGGKGKARKDGTKPDGGKVWSKWVDVHRAKGRDDPLRVGADLSAAKRLAKICMESDIGPDDLEDYMLAYIQDTDKWLAKQGWPLRLLEGRLNGYIQQGGSDPPFEVDDKTGVITKGNDVYGVG